MIPDVPRPILFLDVDGPLNPFARRLVWATTWEQEANEWIGPHIGLPELPFVPWPAAQERADEQDGRYWKTRFVAEYAADRPFAWFDDQISQIDARWCAENHPAASLLQWIDPAYGIRDRDLAVVRRWISLRG